MRRLSMWTLAVLAGTASGATAGEVHTRSGPGTWSSNVQRGTLRGTVANDAGYSFWLMGERIDLSRPVTVIAQVRFISRVDYGGAGLAIIDAGATNKIQKHLRIELSEREDTAGVGGWLGNENHFSGASRKSPEDIKINDWHELALKIDGTKAIGFLDGAEIFNSTVPELKQLGSNLTIAPFVVEADAEIKITVRVGAASQAPPDATSTDRKPGDKKPAAKIGWIEPYGKDETDGSAVNWLSTLPRPSFTDDPKRAGKPNAEWDASYDMKGDRVCVRIASLRTPVVSNHKIAIGYTVTLDHAVFDTGSRTKTLIVTRFSGTPERATAGTCETVTIGGVEKQSANPSDAPDDPYAGQEPLPAVGRIADLLPKTSKKQAEIEKRFAEKVASGTSPAEYRELYARIDELILVLGAYHFFLEPVSRQWHVYDRMHDTWEPTGAFAGDATFSVVRGKVKVTKKRKGKA